MHQSFRMGFEKKAALAAFSRPGIRPFQGAKLTANMRAANTATNKATAVAKGGGSL